MYYANQRCVKINREVVKKTTNRKFLVCYIDNIERAEKELSKTAFQVYMYLICNKDEYELEYSTTHISMKTGMCIESARKAFLELEKCGYLVENADNKHFYNFYEVPQKTKKINIYREAREFMDDETGEVFNLTYGQLLEMIENEAEAKQLWEDAGK